MANDFLNSSLINLYPSALRGGTDNTRQNTIYDPESKIGTEYNLTSAINSITIDGSYVVDEARDGDNYLDFVIHGYQFHAQLTDAFLNSISNDEVWASIRVVALSRGASYKLYTLKDWDNSSTILDDSDSNKFKGVYFSDAEETGTNKYSLLILKKQSGTWTVPETSLLKIGSDTVAIGNTPLDHVITEDEGNINITATNETITTSNITTANITTLNNNNLVGTKGTIVNGVANKAVAIAEDTNGNLRSQGNEHQPVYLENGVVKALTGTIANDITGNAATATEATHAANATTADGLSVGNVGGYNNQIYFSNGVPVVGMKTWVSASEPTDVQGNDGDIWFQYS